MIHSDSLGATLDAINKAFFYERPPSKAQMEEAAKWIAARQIKSGPNAGLFAPTRRDYKEGVRLFTGEKLKTIAESCARSPRIIGSSKRPGPGDRVAASTCQRTWAIRCAKAEDV